MYSGMADVAALTGDRDYVGALDALWENVVSRGLQAITGLLERGVRNGEFRETAVSGLPQLVIAPALVSLLWRILFASRDLDTDQLIDTQVNMLLAYIKA